MCGRPAESDTGRMSDDLEFLLWRRAVGGATEAERSAAAERLARRPSRRRSRSLEADLEQVRAIVERADASALAAARPLTSRPRRHARKATSALRKGD